MTAREALIIEEAYLHTEDAPGLDDVIVYVSDCTVDITTPHDNVISLNFEDFAAIQRKVDEARGVGRAKNFRIHLTGAGDILAAVANVGHDALASLGISWADVPDGYHFVAADEDGSVYAYAEYKPIIAGDCWWSSTIASLPCISLGETMLPTNLDWRNTLFVRPGYTE